MSNVGSHVAVNGYDICFAIEQIFLQQFFIGPLWNEYIPLYMDCVIQSLNCCAAWPWTKPCFYTLLLADTGPWLLRSAQIWIFLSETAAF